MKLIHFFDEEIGIPPEMEANWKSKWTSVRRCVVLTETGLVLDEAFPEITIDLVRWMPQNDPSC